MTGSDTMGGGMYGSDRDGVRAAFADGAVSFWEALDALVGGAEIVVDLSLIHISEPTRRS